MNFSRIMTGWSRAHGARQKWTLYWLLGVTTSQTAMSISQEWPNAALSQYFVAPNWLIAIPTRAAQVYRPLIGGVTMGVAKCTAVILENNTWALSMGHKYSECVCSSFAVNQNNWSAWNDSKLENSRYCFSHLYRLLSKGELSTTKAQDSAC